MGFKHEFKRGGTIDIEANGRTISLRISHVGVDIEDLKTILHQKDQPAFRKIREFKERLFAKIGQRSIVFGSYDRNSVISGIRNKLTAYLAFLDNYPRSRNQVCLI
jgi:trehalose-6-phosphate synthase